MLIKSIVLENIRSYLNEKIEFPEGSVLLSGNIGTGKSTILLALDFALFGLRRGELSGSDLLRHGKDSGSVELIIESDEKEIKIKRTLKRNKNIQQDSGSITIEDSEQSLTPTELKSRVIKILGYPEEILKKSKSMLFRYTVYTPQEQMKEILSENFSDQRIQILRKLFDIDKYGIIRENSKTLLTEFRSLQRELNALHMDLDEKINDKKNKENEKNELKEKINKIEKQLNESKKELEEKKSIRDSLLEKTKKINSLKQELSASESSLKSAVENIQESEKKIEEYKKNKTELEKQIQDFGEINSFEKSSNDIEKEIASLDAEKRELIEKKALLSGEADKLNTILEKGVCEVCGQDVHDKEKFSSGIKEKHEQTKKFSEKINSIDKNINEKREEIKKINELENKKIKKESTERELSNINDSIDNYSKKIIEYKNSKESLENKLNELKSEIEKFGDIDEQYNSAVSDYEKTLSNISEIEKNNSVSKQKFSDIENEIINLENEIKKKEEAKEKEKKISQIILWLGDKFMNLMQVMESHMMAAIQKEFDVLFREWFSMLIEDDNISVRLDREFSPVIEQNGYETSYSNLSGGEKTAVALAYRLALNKMINSLVENIKTKDLIILDEPTDGFSSEQLDNLRDVLNQLGLKQVIIVSHEPKIESFVDSTKKVYKENHISKVE